MQHPTPRNTILLPIALPILPAASGPLAVALLSFALASGCSSSSSSSDTKPQPDLSADQRTDAGDTTMAADSGKAEIFVPDVVTPPGYFEFCIADADCEAFGLSCISTSPTDPDAFCSKSCMQTSDCPDGLVCKMRGETSVCQIPSYCDRCTTTAQCAPGMKCLKNASEESFCSIPCHGEDPASCPPGHTCRKTGTGLEDYFCFPLFGKCKGDGTQCAPCQSSDDCLRDYLCHENATTHETYCAKKCTQPSDCDAGYGCHEMASDKASLCTLEVEGNPVETCSNGKKLFCEPCMLNYECSSGLCYSYPEMNRYLCSFPCDTSKYPDGGCPSGLFCVPNKGAEEGKACAPPPAWGCQGFLNCLGVECPMGEKCRDGFCQPK